MWQSSYPARFYWIDDVRRQRARSGEVVTHPDQFRTVAPASAHRYAAEPLAHQVVVASIARRALADYDQLTQAEVRHE